MVEEARAQKEAEEEEKRKNEKATGYTGWGSLNAAGRKNSQLLRKFSASVFKDRESQND